MKILHVSDTHGDFRTPIVKDVDVVVHSGDFLPNRTRGLCGVEEDFQRRWVEEHAEMLRRWVGGRKLLVCSGNHDFIDVASELQKIGIDATSLDGKLVDVDGVTFYGFPWVPWFTGEWNFEVTEERLGFLLSELRALANQGAVDVLVSHGPMWGVLDRNYFGERCGSRAIRSTLRDVRHLPMAMLCGHIHESNGIVTWKGMTVSNAACGSRVVEI